MGGMFFCFVFNSEGLNVDVVTANKMSDSPVSAGFIHNDDQSRRTSCCVLDSFTMMTSPEGLLAVCWIHSQ